MRDAITTLDKCLAYSTDLTIENVVTALGLSNYDTMCRFLSSIVEVDNAKQIEIINEVYMAGKDLKQFIKDFTYFVVDCCKFNLGARDYITCPDTDDIISAFKKVDFTDSTSLLNSLVRLQTDIKWDTNPLARIEAWCITKE
jgi:DNA polymerase-3 subunit gamma/tau